MNNKKMRFTMYSALLLSIFFMNKDNYVYASGYAGGVGTVDDPYLISSPEQLNFLRQQVNNGTASSGAYYELTNNINLKSFDADGTSSNGNWIPIGTELMPFSGIFNGNDYMISNYTIKGDGSHVGLFGYIDNGEINDLTLANFEVHGNQMVGSLAGEVENNSVIDGVYAEGKVIGNDSSLRVGGLIGYLKESTITNSGSGGYVEGNEAVGGLIGRSYLNAKTEKLYSSATVHGVTEVGGLIGKHTSSTIRAVNATGNVTGDTSVGGLVGYLSDGFIRESIAKVKVNSVEGGRFVGYKKYNGKITSSYVDTSLNKGMPDVYTDEDTSKTDIVELDPLSMVGDSALNNMPDLDFSSDWVISDDGSIRLNTEKDIESSSSNQASVQLVGTVKPLMASISVPTTSLEFVIDPNQEEGKKFVAPEFNVVNDTNAALTLELKSFEQKTSIFNDVLPDAHADWNNLSKDESMDLALSLEPLSGSGWKSLVEGQRYVADSSNYYIGAINPNASVSFKLNALHGSTFTKALRPEYKMVLLFDFE